MENNISRKEFLKRAGLLGIAVFGTGAVLSSCGGKKDDAAGGAAADKCNDLSALTDAEKGIRTNYEYVTKTADPAKHCLNCQFYQAPAQAGDCASCQLFKGPITDDGYCKTWVQKAG